MSEALIFDPNVHHIAVLLVVISIIISGIAIGLGKAFGYKRVENFGVEELLQAIVNAALIGGFVTINETISIISREAVKGQFCADAANPNGISILYCIFDKLSTSFFTMFSELAKASNILGYYQSLVLNFGAFSITPLANLQGISNVIFSQLTTSQFLLVMLMLQLQILTFISQNAIQVLFPLGLLFRSFFATRKLGGFLVALSLSFFLLYPIFILMFSSPELEVSNAAQKISVITKSPEYAPSPIIDLNNNNAVAQKLDFLSGREMLPQNNSVNSTSNVTLPPKVTTDLTNDLTVMIQSTSNAISKLLLYAVLAPVFSLIISIIFIKEFGNILSGELLSVSITKNI